jgi:hypothetical protein
MNRKPSLKKRRKILGRVQDNLLGPKEKKLIKL